MPFRKSSDESDEHLHQVHLNSSVISIHNKKRHHQNISTEIMHSEFKHSLISKSKRERLYKDFEKHYHNTHKNLKLETYRSYKDEDEFHYKRKRSRLSMDLEEKDTKKCDRSSHKNKDQSSNKRESRKHKKTRDHKDKTKRDKNQPKSKKDHKRRKDSDEDEPDAKCANERFEYNDYINIDSDVNEEIIEATFSTSLEPIIADAMVGNDDIDKHTMEQNVNEFLDAERLKEPEDEDDEEDENHNSINHDVDPVNKPFSDEELDNYENYEDENYHHYPVRSKFESLSTDESDIERLLDNENSYDRNSRSGSSGGSSSSESFGSSISSSRNPKKNRKKPNNKEETILLQRDEDKLIFSPVKDPESEEELDLRPLYYPAVQGCRLVEEFECLNKIEEGTYGVVFRARDRKSNEIVALKRLKMEKERDGFPITSLREINTLMKAQHENIVTVREVVVGSNMDKIYLVMDFIEHDLKSLMISMVKPFEICEVKCLMIQLLSAVAHLHDNWILHRDLKTSNLLLSHKGVLKVADFGLAREYGSPLKNYTRVVVTLWYRAPELLLGTKVYSTQIDLWSVGCIFGELLLMVPLFPGKSEADQINILFKELGTPNEKIWPGVSNLPNIKRFEFGKFEYNRLGKKFNLSLSESGLELINRFLAYCPDRRITAEEALKHTYFNESPKAISSEMFPTRPAKSEGGVLLRSRLIASPKPPSGGQGVNKLNDDRILELENIYNRRGLC